LRTLRNPNLNLVLLHMPIPHPPGIWNSTEHVLTDGPADYIDNLRLADLTLGQMRRTLEKTGDWDSSAVLVSSDHPYRPELWSKLPGWTSQVAKITQSRWQPYIPFFLKLPKQQQGAVYDREFNSVLSADMLFQLLKGRLQSSKDVIRYLDKH
jgi:arylsulfatase A-like enzyme